MTKMTKSYPSFVLFVSFVVRNTLEMRPGNRGTSPLGVSACAFRWAQKTCPPYIPSQSSKHRRVGTALSCPPAPHELFAQVYQPSWPSLFLSAAPIVHEPRYCHDGRRCSPACQALLRPVTRQDQRQEQASGQPLTPRPRKEPRANSQQPHPAPQSGETACSRREAHCHRSRTRRQRPGRHQLP